MSGADLHEACKSGDLDRVKELVRAGVSVNHIDENGQTPLDHAEMGNHTDIVRFLEEKGATHSIGNGQRKRDFLGKRAN